MNSPRLAPSMSSQPQSPPRHPSQSSSSLSARPPPFLGWRGLGAQSFVLLLSISFCLFPPGECLLTGRHNRPSVTPSEILSFLLDLSFPQSTALAAKKTPPDIPPPSSVSSNSVNANTPRRTTKRHAKSKHLDAHHPPEPMHWTNASDHFSIEIASDNCTIHSNNSCSCSRSPARVQSLALTIRGQPLPLRRHRNSRGFIYNPSAVAQASFRNETSRIVFGMDADTIASSDATSTLPTNAMTPPLFSTDIPLSVTLNLRLRRPLSHFRAGRRESCTLKASAPAALAAMTRTDVDNLAKFVLDACNGLLYDDDRQIQSLHVIKQLDSEGECRGATQLFIRAIDPQQDDLLRQSVEPHFSPSNWNV